jgi:hypothetical protein
MFRFKTMILSGLMLGAAAAWAQEKTPAPAPMDEACAKRCQKGMGDHKAMMEKNAAAWKEIRAAVEDAKKAKGDKKIADLETALDRLVSFHESMMAGMGPMPGMDGCGPMGGDHPMAHGAGCCGDMKSMGDCCGDMHAAKPGGADCCSGMTAKKQASMACCADKKAMAECCGHDAMAMSADCPMMKKGI